MDGEDKELVTITVEPRSVNAEIVFVLRTTALVVLAATFAVTGIRALDAGDGAQGFALYPFQKLVKDVSSAEQRAFRSIQEGLLEAERVRSTTKVWPAPEVLAAQGIPPFAPDPIDTAHYAWTLVGDGVYFNYVGMPADAAAPMFLIHLQEPDKGAVMVGQPIVDEVHHVLTDGTAIHASVWTKAGPHRAVNTPLINPIAEGYTQLLVGAQKNP